MQVEIGRVKEVEKVIKSCPPGCKCRRQGIENLCKAEDVGLEGMVECLDEHPFECMFSIPFGGLYYCSCRPRVYIAKTFHM